MEKESGARALRTLFPSPYCIAIASKNVYPRERKVYMYVYVYICICVYVRKCFTEYTVGQRYRGTIQRETWMNNRWLSVTGARRVADRSPR